MSAAKKARHDGSILERNLPDQTGKHRISFGPEFRGRDFRLFELPEELVSQIESGEVVKVVGSTEPKSDAVICSKKKTYSLKKAETSNSVFVVQSSSSGEFTVTGSCQHYYELKPIAPRLEMVAEALRGAVYNGNDPEHEKRIDRSLLLSYEQLRATVQASDNELENALFSHRVVELMGKMRMLSKKAVREVMGDLIDTIMENSWPTDKVDEALCKQAMRDTDHVLLTFAFKSLGRMCEERGLWELDHSAIAKCTADILFNSQVKAETPWDCEDFLLTWAARTPGAAPDESLLGGIAVKIDATVGGGKCYRYLPLDDVTCSGDPHSRLAALFAVKPKYEEHELKHYFADLVGGTGQPKTLPELLLQNARFIDGFYVAK